MKTRIVKIHDRKWFDDNCFKDDIGDYYHEGVWLFGGMHNLIGCEVIVCGDVLGYLYVKTETGNWSVHEWMIEYEVNQQDKST